MTHAGATCSCSRGVGGFRAGQGRAGQGSPGQQGRRSHPPAKSHEQAGIDGPCRCLPSCTELNLPLHTLA
jgi:hypothetical protein